MSPKTGRPAGLLISVFLLSAAALAYEVLLTRLFSVIQWRHFSYMVISLALLGYGASGSFLKHVEHKINAPGAFSRLFGVNALAFGLFIPAGFLLAQRLPFNPLEMGWDARHFLYLQALYLLPAVPFFCAANCIGLALMRRRGEIPRIYAADLAGAGAGALGVIFLLFALTPLKALFLLGGVGLAAGLPVIRRLLRRPAWTVAAAALLAALAWMTADERFGAMRPSEFKDLSQALRASGAETAAERFSPLGVVTVVRNKEIPLRYAPGLSLNATKGPPEQLAVYNDGNFAGAITRFDGDWDALGYLDDMTSALPYHLLDRPRVLVLGAGGGADVLQALYHGAPAVDAAELDPRIIDLATETFGAFSGRLYDRPAVRVHAAEARGFTAGTARRFDLIHVALLDAVSAASAGMYALSESYLYTVEAFEDYLDRLAPGGMLSVTRWVKLPPRDGVKLFATAAEALKRRGVADPGGRLAMIRGWKTTTLLVKNGRFTAAEIATLNAFCETRSFDPVWHWNMDRRKANRFNILDAAYFHDAARAVLGPDREDFFRRYKFNVRPATDDRPYFFHFFKWRTLPELLSLQARSGLGQLGWGYLILVATLVQAVLASAVFILLPLLLKKRTGENSGKRRAGRLRTFVYFMCVGLAFLFMEIAFIQKFILFLSHPLYAVAVVLAATLAFAGLGSRHCARVAKAGGAGMPDRRTLSRIMAAISGISVAYLLALPHFFRWALPWPDPVKIGVSVLLIAPLAFFMGMPFPLGLFRLTASTPERVPWAWAVNGCASVISAVLAALLAVHFGFTVVVICAVCLYLAAGGVGPGDGRPLKGTLLENSD